MRTHTVAVGLILCLGFASTATASSLGISASIGSLSYINEADTASYPDQLVTNQTTTGFFTSVGFYERAAFGDLGLAYSASASCPSSSECFQVGTGGNLGTESADGVFVTGATTADFLRLHIILEGSANQIASSQAGNSHTAIGYALTAFGSVIYSGGPSCTTASPVCSSGTVANTYVLIPLNSYAPGTVYTVLSERLISQFSCIGDPGNPCFQEANFSDSAKVGNATVVDANGNPVAGSAITSGSGYDYTQSISVATPEPSTVSLTGLGMLAIAACRKRTARA